MFTACSNEAIEMATRAGATRTILVHYRAELRHRVESACSRLRGAIGGHPGLAIEVGDRVSRPAVDGSRGNNESPATDGAIAERPSPAIRPATLP